MAKGIGNSFPILVGMPLNNVGANLFALLALKVE